MVKVNLISYALGYPPREEELRRRLGYPCQPPPKTKSTYEKGLPEPDKKEEKKKGEKTGITQKAVATGSTAEDSKPNVSKSANKTSNVTESGLVGNADESASGFTSEEDQKILEWKATNLNGEWAVLDTELGKPKGAAKARFKDIKSREGAIMDNGAVGAIATEANGERKAETPGDQKAANGGGASRTQSELKKGDIAVNGKSKDKGDAASSKKVRIAKSDIDTGGFNVTIKMANSNAPNASESFTDAELEVLKTCQAQYENDRWLAIRSRFFDMTMRLVSEDAVMSALKGK